MKKSAVYSKLFFLFCFGMMIFLFKPVLAQNAKQEKELAKENAIKTIVLAQRYVFNAQSATSMKGRTRQLSPGYDLVVKKDTVDAYLPYFGVAYTAPIGSSEGGIKFTSVDFEYRIEDAKQGGWSVAIKPKKVQDVTMMTLSISKTGYTTLQVNSNTRQMISFYGTIEEIKPH